MTNNDLLLYLERCGGKDRHEFKTDDGRPDMDAARSFAESMRDRLGDLVGESVIVEQRNYVVDITLLSLEPTYV